jgi:predicted nucleic acid-binding Zn ribbon protein
MEIPFSLAAITHVSSEKCIDILNAEKYRSLKSRFYRVFATKTGLM